MSERRRPLHENAVLSASSSVRICTCWDRQPLSFSGLMQFKFISPHIKSGQCGFREALVLCSYQRPRLPSFYGSCGVSESCSGPSASAGKYRNRGACRGVCGRLRRSLLGVLHITFAHVPLANPNREGGWEISN